MQTAFSTRRRSMPGTISPVGKVARVISGLIGLPVMRDLHSTGSGSSQHLATPFTSGGAKGDQVIRRRRSLAPGTAQLSPGHQPSHVFHDLADIIEIPPGWRQRNALDTSLQTAQQIGSPALADGVEERDRHGLQAALQADNAIGLRAPVRLFYR